MEFGVLGPLMLRTAEGTLTLPSAKQRALLAVLLLEAPRNVVSAERLIDELWGEDPPATAIKALQVHVSNLRRLLGPTQPVVTRPTGYALELDPDTIDVHRFDSLLSRARSLRSGGDAAGALSALVEALALWRGPALADVELLGPGATEAGRLEGRRAIAQEERIELELEQGDAAALVPELEALVSAHPYRERMHGLLMLALYRAGRQADALEAFRRARARLVEELGLDPGPELVRLEAAILAQDPAIAQPPPTTGAAPSGAPPPDAPVPAAAEPAPNPMPRPTSTILGRDAVLTAALAMLERSDVRLLTLTGTGGIGKTRLGLELAGRLGDRSRFVELAAITEAERILPAIATAVGAEDASEPAIAGALDGVGAVLFLDNFEQVLEGAPVVASLLRRISDLTILATSRAPLRLAGEHELPVGPLERDSAVELFVSRVRERDPAFSPGSDELAAIAAVCARIDGVPLAIELAAARTRVLAPSAMLLRIERRLAVLTDGRRDAPERHRTLRATIAWSHDLLTEAERRLFAELAVFPAGCGLEACEAVAGGEVLDPLSGLVDHALVVRDGERFAMLETIREYAVEQLSALPDAVVLRRRHALWCAELAEAAEPELDGSQQAWWFARLDAELESLRTAAAWAVAEGEPEFALRIGGSLWRYWLARVFAAEVGGILRAALATGAGDAAVRAKAFNSAGVLAGATDDFAAARECFEQALALGRQSRERRQTARAVGNLGMIAFFAQDYEAARAYYEEAAEIWQELGDVQGQSLMRQNLALVHLATGEFEAALAMVEESVELSRQTGARGRIGATVSALSRLLVFRRPRDPRIPELLREALELSAEVGERLQTAECLEVVAHFALIRGEPAVGARLIGAGDAERVRAGADRKPDELPYFEETARGLAEALGPLDYERRRAEGRSMALESAVAEALAFTARRRLRVA
ncbi:MAG: tetratricopeptide repeat protein [Solirubrobacterales bacterium]|nr:tetratricopeptide repeat protein [Solirubrobacterales bacterium]